MGTLELETINQIRKFLISLSSLYKNEIEIILQDIDNNKFESFHAFIDKYYQNVPYSEELKKLVNDLVKEGVISNTFLNQINMSLTNDNPLIVDSRPLKVLNTTILGIHNSSKLNPLSQTIPATIIDFFNEKITDSTEISNISSNNTVEEEKEISKEITTPLPNNETNNKNSDYTEIDYTKTMEIPTITLYNNNLAMEDPFANQTGVFVPINNIQSESKEEENNLVEKEENTIKENIEEKPTPSSIPLETFNLNEVKIDEMPKPSLEMEEEEAIENQNNAPIPIYTTPVNNETNLNSSEEVNSKPSINNFPSTENKTTDNESYIPANNIVYSPIYSEKEKQEEQKKIEEETKEKLKQTILETQLYYLENASSYIQSLEDDTPEEIYNSLLTLNDIRYIYHCISKLTTETLNKLLPYIEENIKENKKNAINIFIEEAIKRTLHSKSDSQENNEYSKKKSA